MAAKATAAPVRLAASRCSSVATVVTPENTGFLSDFGEGRTRDGYDLARIQPHFELREVD